MGCIKVHISTSFHVQSPKPTEPWRLGSVQEEEKRDKKEMVCILNMDAL